MALVEVAFASFHLRRRDQGTSIFVSHHHHPHRRRLLHSRLCRSSRPPPPWRPCEVRLLGFAESNATAHSSETSTARSFQGAVTRVWLMGGNELRGLARGLKLPIACTLLLDAAIEVALGESSKEQHGGQRRRDSESSSIGLEHHEASILQAQDRTPAILRCFESLGTRFTL